MNEKEKKAIIYFDDILTNKCDIEFWQRIKNLIDKQQKEIEELKKDNIDNIQVIYGGRRFGTERMVLKDYISKDKIRELLKSKDIELTGVISYRELEKLLEEQ